jgi:single-stranded-DNA-specific exonuclease
MKRVQQPYAMTIGEQVSWFLREPDGELVRAVARESGLSPMAATVLVNRGHRADGKLAGHIAPDLKALHDPALLPDMEQACARIRRALDGGETILIHGDYDVDGVTATALLVRFFRLLGADVHWHVPNRFSDGYAFGAHSVAKAKEVGAQLVISVDNGTSEVKTIAELSALGIDTVVTDHHEPPLGELPAAVALLNPKVPTSSTYPFRELCGAAVALKLAWGLSQDLSGPGGTRADLRDFLVAAMGLVAVATVCDVVPLVDENRTLARFGLRALTRSPWPGLAALVKLAGVEAGKLPTAMDLAFGVGPRINACGRLGSAGQAVELFLEDDPRRATERAAELDTLNRQRKEVESALMPHIMEQAQLYADEREHPLLVLAGQDWHQGVLGILASRVVERMGRPALLIGLTGDSGRGSARSVPGFHLLEALRAGSDLWLRGGGHAQAAGCEIETGQIDAFRSAVNEQARKMLNGGRHERLPLSIDAALPLASMTRPLMGELDRLEPWGQHNEEPRFLARDARLAEPPRRVGDGSHLMLKVRSGQTTFKAMAFGMGERAAELGRDIELVFTPNWNTFRGKTNLELRVVDFR